jgi:alkylhydroperoxidase/carboxymuconolactone decarboxylase family protein YurZ
MMMRPPKEKELVAIGIVVAVGRRPSMDDYLAASQKARATRDEIKQAVR